VERDGIGSYKPSIGMDRLIQALFWVAFGMLLCALFYELLPSGASEGFEGGLVGVGDSKFWAKLVPRRGDIGPEQEEGGLVRDKRYFGDYVDVQRFGVKTDFCRFVQKGSDEKNKFLACGLGGTDSLSSIAFRGPSVRDGFVLGRDDYMRDIDGDGRDDYCRIVKQSDGTFRPECNSTTETGFSAKLVPDSNPPSEIQTLLHFYQGCVFWLRLRDDMLDYAQNLYINTAGDAAVQEVPPRPQTTEGLQFNGINQYIRLGDDPYLNLGSTVQLRSLRAIHFWVRFDEFTNNAHIFDFGNGAGIDNVWMGILNRGNLGTDVDLNKKTLLCGGDSVVPDAPSGAQDAPEMSPQELMKTTDANVEEFTCEGFAVAPKVRPRAKRNKAAEGLVAKTADLCYEIWDKDQRKLRVVIKGMFELGKWTHIVLTAQGTDSFRPDLAFYKNGELVRVEQSGWLPQRSITEKNYLGRSNWSDVTSQYANKDELLKGALFDFRGYIEQMNEKTIKDSYKWGANMLGLKG
jgi:hypothetical protein